MRGAAAGPGGAGAAAAPAAALTTATWAAARMAAATWAAAAPATPTWRPAGPGRSPQADPARPVTRPRSVPHRAAVPRAGALTLLLSRTVAGLAGPAVAGPAVGLAGPAAARARPSGRLAVVGP